MPAGPREPSAAARNKILQLKDRRRQLSATEYADARALAARIARKPAKDQADWLWESYKAKQPGVTDLERGELTADTFRKLPGGKSLEEGLAAVEPKWEAELCSESGRQPGAPSALFVSPAAMGAIQMIQACPGINRRCQIAKLFAKHIKLGEQAEALRAKGLCIGAGTPNRLAKLAEDGALSLLRLKWIVLDVRMDPKQRTLLDMPEVRDDWWALWEKHLRGRVAAGGARVVLYGGEPGERGRQ